MLFRKKFNLDSKMIQNLRPTSKASLKQICLLAAKGNLEEAQKLYDYMIKDMEDLPLFDAPIPSRMEEIKNGLSDTFRWVNDNQEQIFSWIGIIKDLFNKNGGGGIPPAAMPPTSPIPSIN